MLGTLVHRAKDVVVTDPPYGTGGWRRPESGLGSNPAAALVREPWDACSVDWLREVAPAPVLTFYAPANMPELLAAATEAGYRKCRFLYMRKRDPKPQVAGRVAWSVEPIVVLSAEGFQLFGGTDLLEASTPRLNRDTVATGHPYQKPVEVMDWLLAKLAMHPEGHVVDPFMGTGTTGVACARLGLPFLGIEREWCWYKQACERIEAAHAQGRLFDWRAH
jgi:site-specific DNA-methyltransferase (adenine-specific)